MGSLPKTVHINGYLIDYALDETVFQIDFKSDRLLGLSKTFRNNPDGNNKCQCQSQVSETIEPNFGNLIQQPKEENAYQIDVNFLHFESFFHVQLDALLLPHILRCMLQRRPSFARSSSALLLLMRTRAPD
ncbi:MAG: hypothetical protein V4633_06795 [Pseudomonadota bacterium]